jgi:3-oxoadipate enol-lactonase
MLPLDKVTLHYAVDGDSDGMPVVFGNSLGTDFRLWDQLLPLLPGGLKIIRFDKRGHGLSSCPGDACTMDELVDDTAQLLRALEIRDCLFVGLSIGGLIAQGLAANHPELVRAIVISNSAARVGTPQLWGERLVRGILQARACGGGRRLAQYADAHAAGRLHRLQRGDCRDRFFRRQRATPAASVADRR